MIDRYVFLITGPVFAFFQVVILSTFIKYRLIHHSPEDVIFVLVISELAMNISYFSSAGLLPLT